ncbi:MAG: hypothetical protein ACK4NX_02440, partial [Candidatus Paceibacteria bacterium]
MTKDLAIGLDIGGFKIRGVLATERGRILKEREVRFIQPPSKRQDFLAVLFPLIDFLKFGNEERIKGIGIGVASVVYKNKAI